MSTGQPIDVSIGAGAAGFNFLPVFIAQKLGLFAKRGINVTVKRTGSTDKATAALTSGDLDIAITPPEGAIANYVGGGPLRIVGGNLNGLPLTLVANPKFKRIEDLRGATLGTSSLTEGTALYTMEILARHGLYYPGDYEFSLVGIHTARWEALKAGTLDAALQLIPLNFVAIDNGFTNLGEASDYLPDIAFISIIVSKIWADNHRDVLIDILAALKEANDIIFDESSDDICIDLAAEVIKSEPRYAQMSLDLVRGKKILARDLSIPPQALQSSIRVMEKAGLLSDSTPLNPTGAYDDSYRLDALIGQTS